MPFLLSTVGGMDPRSPEPAAAMDLVDEATDRVLSDLRDLSDADVAAPSGLPDWSRGHVLTHLARNADGLGNLFESARTGETRYVYPSRERRNADIEVGAGRSVEEQTADLVQAHDELRAGAERVTDWNATVARTPGDAGIPVWWVPLLRLGELEIHHTDLDVGYTFDRWPSEMVRAFLPYACAELADRAGEPLGLRATDSDARVEASASGARIVDGPARSLLAWVTGRHDGADLRVAPDGPLPSLGTWR
jgi:maleylpyruvate isomerase